MIKIVLIGGASTIVLRPLFSPSTGWHLDDGLLIAAAIFLFYGCFARNGKVLVRDSRKFRIQLLDLLLIAAFPLYLLYIGNGRFVTSLDTQGTRYLAPLIWKERTLDLSAQPPFRGKELPYSAIRIKKEVLSSFPLGTAFLAAPYAGIAQMVTNSVNPRLLLIWEKHFAAIITVATVCLFFFMIRNRFTESAAAGSAVVFAVATPLMSCASQAMWSFTGELFFLTLGLFFLFTKRYASWKNFAGGIAIGLAFFCRPTALLFAGLLFLLLLLENKRTAMLSVAAFLLTGILCSVFLSSIYGHPLGGYGMINEAPETWNVPPAYELAGVLFSPSRGLLVYFPYLLLTIFFWKGAALYDRRWFIVSLLAIVGIVALTSSYHKWWGGHSLGPRLITEGAPFFAILTVPVWTRWKEFGAKKWVLLVLLVFSSLTQILSIYNPSTASWNTVVNIDARSAVLWSWENSQLAATWDPGWQYPP